MMVGWVSTDTALEYLRAHLAKANTETLQEHWTPLLSAKLRTAYWSIVSAFVARGYSRAQVDAWDRGAEFQQDLGVFLALKPLAALNPSDFASLDALDRRPELLGDAAKGIPAVPLTTSGVFIDPAGTHGQITVGAMSTTSERFNLDPEDTRLGEVTRF